MFCYQCQEAAKNVGCTNKGVCGKEEETANLQDLLIHVLRGIAVYGEKLNEYSVTDNETALFVARGLFATITNGNFDNKRFVDMIREGLKRRDIMSDKFRSLHREKQGKEFDQPLHDSAVWFSETISDFEEKAKHVGVMATENEDARCLKELLIIGLKGIAAYADHAAVLGFEDNEIYAFIMEALASTTKNLSVDEMVQLVMKAGETAIKTMTLLDEANTSAYGHPEITEVNIGVRNNPGIL